MFKKSVSAVLAVAVTSTVPAPVLVAHAQIPATRGTASLPAKCDASAIATPADVTLVTAKIITDPVEYCRIDGYVTTRDPGPNRVNFMLALPAEHNGRYLFTVQGGAAGFVPDPTAPHLREGYAIASTDKGTRVAHGLDFSFRSDPAMDLDWAHRGVHVAAVATQKLTRDFYGVGALPRYAMGCSGGGDGTLTEAEMYPADFDAYIPGAMNTDWAYGTTLQWGNIANYVHAHPESWISPEQYDRIFQVMLDRYDAADSAVDGLVWDPRAIQLDGKDRQALNFLSDAQFELLRVIRAGVRDKDGNLLAPGFWLANPKEFPRFLTGMTPPPWTDPEQYPAGFMVADTSSKAIEGNDFSFIDDVDFQNIGAVPKGIDITKFDHHKLAKLRDSGAKMIMWVGGAEEAVSPWQVLGYTDRAQITYGPEKSSFFRTFVVPGLHHCFRGDNAPTDAVDKFLKAAQRWVEDGQAPDEIVLTNELFDMPARGTYPAVKAKPATRSYLLCPYPQRSVFKGGPDNANGLDVADAKNWRCEAGVSSGY